MVLRSRSFGFAETVSECAAVYVTRLRMARREGDGWLTAKVWQWIQQLRNRYSRMLRRGYLSKSKIGNRDGQKN
jgi:hypothetical protein